jgi:hypothetical protein
MIKYGRHAALGLLAALALSGCSPRLSPFTQKLYEDNNWTEAQLKKIQFYLSDDIVLRRQLGGGSSEISDGKIRVIDGRQVAEVVIRRGTPGVFLFSPKENRFAVSFESGGNDRFLVFGPSPRYNERYVLMASEWERNGGTVTYDGRQWEVSSQAAYSTLMVDLKRLQQVDVNKREASGRRIDD